MSTVDSAEAKATRARRIEWAGRRRRLILAETSAVDSLTWTAAGMRRADEGIPPVVLRQLSDKGLARLARYSAWREARQADQVRAAASRRRQPRRKLGRPSALRAGTEPEFLRRCLDDPVYQAACVRRRMSGARASGVDAWRERQAVTESAKEAEIARQRERQEWMHLTDVELLRRIGVPPEWQPEPAPDSDGDGAGLGVTDTLVVPDAGLAGTEGEPSLDAGSPTSASVVGDSVNTAVGLGVVQGEGSETEARAPGATDGEAPDSGGPGVTDTLVVPDAGLAGTEVEPSLDAGSPTSASAGGDSVNTALVLEVGAQGAGSEAETRAAGTADGQALVRIRFRTRVVPYQAGEIAGFPRWQARQFVGNGVAEWVTSLAE
jgi:hypothetical protein